MKNLPTALMMVINLLCVLLGYYLCERAYTKAEAGIVRIEQLPLLTNEGEN